MRIINIAIVSLASVFGAAAQDRITVPLSNPSQPVTIKVTMAAGSIKITAGTGRDLIVSTDSDGRLRRARAEAVPAGMRRIGGSPALNIEEDHNVVTVSAGSNGAGAGLVIETPLNTNLQLRTTNPSIDVTGVNGDIEVENTNGSITLANVSGSVVAHTVNGSVTASLTRMTVDKPMSFTSLNGKVDVTLPADTKARLRLKTDNGTIYSDFDVKLEPDTARAVVENGKGQSSRDVAAVDKEIEQTESDLQQLHKRLTDTHPDVRNAQKRLEKLRAKREKLLAKSGDSNEAKGKYRISINHAVTGTINGGGPEYTFQTMNGNILIHKAGATSPVTAR